MQSTSGCASAIHRSTSGRRAAIEFTFQVASFKSLLPFPVVCGKDNDFRPGCLFAALVAQVVFDGLAVAFGAARRASGVARWIGPPVARRRAVVIVDVTVLFFLVCHMDSSPLLFACGSYREPSEF